MAKKEAEKTLSGFSNRVGLVDTESGELLDGGKLIYVPKRVRIKENWFMGMQDGFEQLAKAKIRGEAMNVLLFLMSRMDFENFVRPSQRDICEALSMKKQNVSRAMKELRDSAIIVPGPEKSLKLSCNFGWKGRVQNLRKEQALESAVGSTSAGVDAGFLGGELPPQ